MMINSIQGLSEYFNGKKIPCAFHEAGKALYDVYLLEEHYQQVADDLEWQLPATLCIRFHTLKSKSEMRRMQTLFEIQMKRLSVSEAKGNDLKDLGKLMGVD